MNSAKALLDLQEIDLKLARSRSTYRKISVELEAEGDLKQLRSKSEAARLRVLETRLEHGKLEAEVSSLKERLADIEKRLYSGAITNLRELTALEEEHNISKRNLATAEESVAPASLASDDAALRYDELKSNLAAYEEEWKTVKADLQKKVSEVTRECKELMEVRSGASEEIDDKDLSLYMSLLPRKHGVAVARVERGICQGCRIKLPIREVARLKNADALVVCSSCGRILLAR